MAFLLPVLACGALLALLLLGQQTTMAMNRGEELQRQADFADLSELLTALGPTSDLAVLETASAFDATVLVTNGDEQLLGPSREATRAAIPERPRLPPATTVWPWTHGTIAYAETVDDTTLTALYPTGPLQGRLTRRWLILIVAVASAFGALAAALYPMTRWALRPVRQLNAVATALAEGDLNVRASAPKGAPELLQLGDTFNLMAERVAVSVHRERAFVANASHHLGNLMTPLRIRVESLNRDDHSVEEVIAELDRLDSVVERLLELNRAEDQDVRPIRVDVGAVVDVCCATWNAATEFEDVTLERHGSDSAFAIAMPGAVAEMVDNLIDNALKYGEGTPIAVTVVRGLSNVRVIVADHGPGMTEDEMPQAHGRFWRAKSQQNRPGSGLGLAIVDALATRCGGHFDLRNGPDGGLEASIVLRRTTVNETIEPAGHGRTTGPDAATAPVSTP